MFGRGEDVESTAGGVEKDAPRPATILRVANEIEGMGGEILELFKEVGSPRGEAVVPIFARYDGEDRLIEVETGPWTPELSEEALRKASVVRSSDLKDVNLQLLSAYPVPPHVGFLFEGSPAALLQLDLMPGDPARPSDFAELFRASASERWGVDLDYGIESLPLTEHLLLAALGGDEDGGGANRPVLEPLVLGLGCFVGEVVRRNTAAPGGWQTADARGGGPVLSLGGFDLDPVGKARAFFGEGQRDSVAFFARWVIGELDDAPERGAGV